ncbi:MAG: hypothetical protein R3C14_19270 [Caldilineaceae bacterium]
MQQRLRQQDPAQGTALLQKASQWFLAEGYHEEAVDYAFATGDMAYAAQVLTPLVAHLTTTGRSRQVQAWLHQLPAGDHRAAWWALSLPRDHLHPSA